MVNNRVLDQTQFNVCKKINFILIANRTLSKTKTYYFANFVELLRPEPKRLL